MLWYLLVGTRGGPNRIRILERLRYGPSNAHRLSEELGLAYRTTRHHLRMLEESGTVVRLVERAYATPYELAPSILGHLQLLDELRSEMRRRAMPLPRRVHRLVG